MADLASPPNSLPSSPSFHAHRASRSRSASSLSIDLPKPITPSNTLLITQLHNPTLFQPISLDNIRAQIQSAAPLNSFSPLPSLRRIICSFHTSTDAIAIRKLLETNQLLGNMQARTYFGEPTPLHDEIHLPQRLLKAPQLESDLVISPPASPPHAWQSENPPRDIPAADLTRALSILKTDLPDLPEAADFVSPVSISSDAQMQPRSRSSTILFHPDCGSSPNLPAVMVEDMSLAPGDDDIDVEMDVDASPIEISVDRMSL